MPVIEKVDHIDQGPLLEKITKEGMEEVIRQRKEMVKMGIIDEHGKRIKKEIPEDMLEDSKTEV
jgi:uncharacterized membrane-anchored protein